MKKKPEYTELDLIVNGFKNLHETNYRAGMAPMWRYGTLVEALIRELHKRGILNEISDGN